MREKEVSGKVKPNKLHEAILYLCQKSVGDPGFGATKLNKLLWFADVDAYLRLETPITGAEYVHLQYGPAPRGMKAALDSLQRAGALRRVSDRILDHDRHIFCATRKVRVDCFSANELAILDAKVAEHWGKNARQMKEKSHECIGYRITKMGETIPLYTAFIANRPLTSEERAYAQGLTNVPEYVVG